VLSLAVYGGVLAWACALAPKVVPLTGTLGGIGAALLVLMLVRGLDDLLASSVFLLGGCYVLGLFAGHHPLDERAPLVAAALLASAELATWSLEHRRPVPAAQQVVLARLGALSLLVLAGLAASALVLVASAAPVGRGLAWTLLGSVAAVLAVGVTARLARER
jgi:hypothetical protein